MKKGKTFFTLLGLAGIVTAITFGVSSAMTTHLEQELTKRANSNLLTVALPSPDVTVTPKPALRPTLPPSPTPKAPENTPIPTPEPTPTILRLSLPVIGAEVLSDYSGDVLVFQQTYGDYRTHLGMDFGGEEQQPVYAAADGIVTKASFDYEHGYTVEISHDGGYLTRYSNLSEQSTIPQGEAVSQGDKIGLMGNSGIWEAHLPCHLHFELEQNETLLNPREFFHASLNLQ